ncbi:MAG: tetratricopeptide repeat protein, partial [Candidatus Hodarchaeales archaeon]
RALEFHQKALEIKKTFGHKQGQALSYNNIGNIFHQKGELDQALDYYYRSYNIQKEFGNNQEIAGSCHNIGLIYHQKEDFGSSFEYLEKSLTLFKEEIGNNLHISESLFELIRILLANHKKTEAENYLTQLEKCTTESENKIINQRFRLAQALFLKHGTRARQKMEAEQILQNIVDEDIVEYSITITAMQQLCEVLLEELKLYGEKEVLDETKILISKLYGIGKVQNSYLLIVESLILQAKIALLEGNIEKAKTILTQASLTAEEKQLISLHNKVKNEQKILESQLDQWKELIDRNASMFERITQAQLKQYIKDVQKIIHLRK